jgi:hypothetical protein
MELKFNPWHDPADGRFTFAGSGHYHGAGRAEPVHHAPKVVARSNLRKPQIPTGLTLETLRTGQPVRLGPGPVARAKTGVRAKPAAPRLRGQPTSEFISGVGEGLRGVAQGAAAGVRSALTTNPATTVSNINRGIAGMIDTAIAAEDTPANIQIARAIDAAAHASAREIGRATGSVVGNAALVVAPGAALVKVSALRRLRGAAPRPSFDPPQIGWVKENLHSKEAWKLYNDGAPGARPNQAPTLMRTMPDGSKRPVKFDGFEGDYVIDRKWSVSDRPRARAQLLRQSQALAEHRLIGIWEVPNEKTRIAALKLFKKMNVTNIKVKVVKP